MNLHKLRFTHPDNLTDAELLMAASDLRRDHHQLRPKDLARIVKAVRRRHDLSVSDVARLTGYPAPIVFRLLRT